MRIERDKRDWLAQAIAQGQRDLRAESAELVSRSAELGSRNVTNVI